MWYEIGPVSIIVPPGDWILRYNLDFRGTRSSVGAVNQKVTLSTAHDAETDERLTVGQAPADETDARLIGCQKSAMVALESETTYNVLMMAGAIGMSGINFGTVHDTIVEAVPACFRL